MPNSRIPNSSVYISFTFFKVLRDLPQKTEEVIKVAMTPAQEDLYFQLVSDYKERARRIAMGLTKPKGNESGVGLLMNLRKASNHPLLLRLPFYST